MVENIGSQLEPCPRANTVSSIIAKRSDNEEDNTGRPQSKSRRASKEGPQNGEEIIYEDGKPRLVGFHEYRRRLDNPSTEQLFRDPETREVMISPQLQIGASPIKISKLKLLRRNISQNTDDRKIERISTIMNHHGDVASNDEDEDETKSLYGFPTPGRRGYEDEPMTPLGQSLDDKMDYFRDFGQKEDESILIQAAKAGDISSVNKFIRKHKYQHTLSDTNQEKPPYHDRNNRDALIWSSELGHRLISKKLTNFGFSTAHADNKGWSALMWACHQSHYEIAEQLIKDGADVNHKNLYGSTSLSWASSQGNLKIAKLLIQHGAEVNNRCNEGSTALHRAARAGHLHLIELLLSHGAHINAKDICDMTPLMHACEKGFIDIVNYLLEWKADAESSNLNFQDGDSEEDKLLSLKICNVFIENRFSQTAKALSDNWYSVGHLECAKAVNKRVKELNLLKDRRAERELEKYHNLSKREKRALRRKMKNIS